MGIQEVIQKLKSGNERFVNGQPEHPMQDTARKESLTKGQEPWAIILSCADSRVVPEMAFDTGLGELFVVRVAGNVANTESVASIEYAVANLGSQVIVVLGHESCGAVTAAMAGGDNGANLNQLLGHISPVASACGSDDVNEVVRQNAIHVGQQLTATSKIISDAVDKGELQIIPGYYNLGTGKVDLLE